MAPRVIAGELMTVWLTIQIANAGRTIARVESPIDANAQLFENLELMPDQPHYVHLDAMRVPELPEYGRVLIPDEPIEIQIPQPILSEMDIEKIACGKSVFCVYARVRYRDLSNTPREFRCCYCYRPKGTAAIAGYYLGGKREYNKQT